jgi:hypothetical protein
MQIQCDTPRRVLDVLRLARALITNPAHWTTRHTARDRNGEPVHEWSLEAVSFCAIGAINRAAYEYFGAPGHHFEVEGAWARAAVIALAGNDDHCILTLINDHRGHAVILDYFDRTIARLEGREVGIHPPVPVRESEPELCEV